MEKNPTYISTAFITSELTEDEHILLIRCIRGKQNYKSLPFYGKIKALQLDREDVKQAVWDSLMER
jgi:hypothetical protein